MPAQAKKYEYDQMDLFEFALTEEEPVVKTPMETTFGESEGAQVEQKDNIEQKYRKGASIYYRGEAGVYLNPYSNDHKTSTIKIGESHIVVLTSAIEER
ncbi:hypothetical protein QTG56_23815 (plasmid) [Rossellomorea sp. AcN35-11]|nr:hypothetical protein [Rossellomorea aquimaris]WJV32389.1 hypothetical protein QTG56_23815 [Rossellomorea sp. AcN35-11]